MAGNCGQCYIEFKVCSFYRRYLAKNVDDRQLKLNHLLSIVAIIVVVVVIVAVGLWHFIAAVNAVVAIYFSLHLTPVLNLTMINTQLMYAAL